jgi:hypothetical protein
LSPGKRFKLGCARAKCRAAEGGAGSGELMQEATGLGQRVILAACEGTSGAFEPPLQLGEALEPAETPFPKALPQGCKRRRR